MLLFHALTGCLESVREHGIKRSGLIVAWLGYLFIHNFFYDDFTIAVCFSENKLGVKEK